MQPVENDALRALQIAEARRILLRLIRDARLQRIETRAFASRWSVPAPQAIFTPGRRRAASSARRISSFAPLQSSPMPRCAVSIASATPSPRSHRYSRNAIVLSQSTAAVSHGSLSASGSATTCAAANATRLNFGAEPFFGSSIGSLVV